MICSMSASSNAPSYVTSSRISCTTGSSTVLGEPEIEGEDELYKWYFWLFFSHFTILFEEIIPAFLLYLGSVSCVTFGRFQRLVYLNLLWFVHDINTAWMMGCYSKMMHSKEKDCAKEMDYYWGISRCDDNISVNLSMIFPFWWIIVDSSSSNKFLHRSLDICLPFCSLCDKIIQNTIFRLVASNRLTDG